MNITIEMKESVSRFFKVLSDPTRLSILFLLKEKESCNVSEMVEYLHMEQSAISHQLRILKNHRLVRYTRVGKTNVYMLDDDHIFSILHQVVHHLAEEDAHHEKN